jgi:hypothetical protein
MSSEETQSTTAGASAAASAPGQEAYEEEHVHSVYEQIASHFSSTRYKVGIHVFIYHFDINHTQEKEGCTNKSNSKRTEAQNSSPSVFPSLSVAFIPQKDTNAKQEPNELISFFFSPLEKPWPIIERFLQNLEPGSVGLDVGCGNGKYLAVNRDVFIVASDR